MKTFRKQCIYISLINFLTIGTQRLSFNITISIKMLVNTLMLSWPILGQRNTNLVVFL